MSFSLIVTRNYLFPVKGIHKMRLICILFYTFNLVKTDPCLQN